MSAGIVHEFYARWGIVGVTATSITLQQLYGYPPTIYCAIGGAVAAYLVDSDVMDMHQISTRGEHRLYKIFWPLGFVIECWSYPLAKLLPHRSIYSHLPGLNSIVRIMYYIFPIFLLVYGWQGTERFAEENFAAILFFFLGSVVLDTIHGILDNWRFVW